MHRVQLSSERVTWRAASRCPTAAVRPRYIRRYAVPVRSNVLPGQNPGIRRGIMRPQGGRPAWNVATSCKDAEARNMGREVHIVHDARYHRADEFMAIVLSCWEFVGGRRAGCGQGRRVVCAPREGASARIQRPLSAIERDRLAVVAEARTEAEDRMAVIGSLYREVDGLYRASRGRERPNQPDDGTETVKCAARPGSRRERRVELNLSLVRLARARLRAQNAAHHS